MDHDLELRLLRSFTAVAESLHFGRAAAALHLAQPALSQQIRRLEELLGTPLLLRTSRSVALTPAGAVLLQRARRTLRTLQADMEDVRSVGRGEEGSLNVGFIGSAMLSLLPSVLQRYHASFPRVQMRLHEAFTAQVLRGLADETLDAGLLRDGDPAPGIHREVLWTERYVAVVSADHPLAKRKAIRATVLRQEPFVFYARSAGTLAYDKPLALCAGDGFHPRVAQEASHWVTILRLIAAGLGVSIAPACVRGIASSDVVCLPLIGAASQSVVELAYRDGDERPLVQQFARVARTSPQRSAAGGYAQKYSADKVEVLHRRLEEDNLR